MDTKYRLLKIDYWIQKILGIAILICFGTFVGFAFGLLGLIPFGAAQVLSGLVFAIGYGDRKRINYLIVVALFFLLWYVRSEITYYGDFVDIILYITPIALGLSYFQLTAKEYKEMKSDSEEQYLNNEQILDA